MKSLIREDSSPTSFLLFFVISLLAINLFVVSSSICLWDDDEAAYAGFGLRMIETGDWVNPQFVWSEVHRKTPFHFWTIAIAYKIFGVNEFAVRFPSALAVLLTALSILVLSTKIWGENIGKWATIIFSGNFLCVSMGKMSLTDAWLMFFESVAILSMLLYIKKPSLKWNFIFWISISIAVLVKGPPILILSGGIWLGFFILSKQRKKIIGLHPWIFGLLSLIPFSLWMYFSYQKDGGELLSFLYDWYVLQRIGGSVFGQTGPPGYHFVVALVAFIPWLPFFLYGIWRTFSTFKKDVASTVLFLWFLFGWIFYELMSSKLPSYAMGAHPAFAISTALVLAEYISEETKSKRIPLFALQIFMISIWIALAAGVVAAFYFLFPDYLKYSFFISIPILSIALIYFFLSRKNKVLASVLFSMSTLLLIWGIAGTLLDYTPLKGSKKIVAKMSEYTEAYESSKKVSAAMVGFTARQKRMSFPFYLERQFKDLRQMTIEEAIQALNAKEKIILLAGLDATADLKKALEDKKISETVYFETVQWQSINDQFKNHPFAILHNFNSSK
jgi:4-amino-4-deoxy-L-arabinose transferase-like glycosyltransferase